MNEKLTYTVAILAVLALFWLWYSQTDKKEKEIGQLQGVITALETQIDQDQVTRVALETKIDSLKNAVDTLEVEKLVYLVKWDTVTAERIINDPNVDSTIRATLDACLNVDRYNNRIIRHLKQINTENEALVISLKETIEDQETVIELRTQATDALEKQNKRLRRQRDVTALVGLGLLIGILLQ